MKCIISFLVFLCFNFTFYAQFHQKADERQMKRIEKKSVFIELIDISGKTHKGRLWYADSSELVISNKATNPDTLISLNPECIYSMKFIQKDRYGKRFVHHFIVAGVAAAIITAITYSTGEAVMVGPGFVFGVLAVAYGTPTALATALIPYKRTRSYIVNSDNSIFLKAYKFMDRKKIKDQAVEGITITPCIDSGKDL